MVAQSKNKQLHIIVSGWVQGVGFRYFTQSRAVTLGIKGYVRNLRNGQVEIVAEGQESDLKSFIGYLRRWPPSARVADIKVTERPYSGNYRIFRVRF